MRHARILLSAFAVLLLLAACNTQPEGGLLNQAVEDSVLDFEGLPEGYVVDEVSIGMGISGFDAGGVVGVYGTNPGGAIPGSEGGGFYPAFPAGTNAAIIFDATCDGAVDAATADTTCSGGAFRAGQLDSDTPVAGNGNNDDDLYNPGLGNVLIIAENLVDVDNDDNIDDPDDADVPGENLEFDFTSWGPNGSVIVKQVVLTVQDVEQNQNEGGGLIRLFGEGGLEIAVIPVPTTGDGGTETVTVDIDYAPVLAMTVSLEGSGAIDNLRISTDIPDMQPGRFTGGINFVDESNTNLRTQAPRGDDALIITGGLTLHCDNELSNNLEINWAANGQQNRWHIRKESLLDIVCLDDPDIEQRPPRAPLDTLIAQADGRLTYGDFDNATGSIIRFKIVDAGEPGRDDTMSIMIWEPGADPDSDAPILDVFGHLRRGANLQAHYDQPHGNNWNR